MDVTGLTWEQFETLFNEQYFPQSYREEKALEFMCLLQGDMSIREYEAKFNDLSRFAPSLVESEHMRCLKFEKGLKNSVRRSLVALRLRNFRDLVAAATRVEQDNLAYCQSKEEEAGRVSVSGRPSVSGGPQRSGATHSFISSYFVQTLKLKSENLEVPMTLNSPLGCVEVFELISAPTGPVNRMHTTGRPVVMHFSVTGRPVYTGFYPVWPEIVVLTPVFGKNPN
ncbi:hypothetical protein L484_024918 [Morus notabilis]|uniref:Retrotransposon gag domain-containing protein n=1 Tax=Morus notabilis TaxID=981085 RepID=W9R3H7_9ROSA|nr:hypothetical protein L484_024918 [Morus notabilis]